MFKLGDEVIINPELDSTGRFTGVTWVIEKIPVKKNEVNYMLRERDGSRRLRTRGDNIITRGENGKFPGPKSVTVTDVADEPWLHNGTVVRMRGQGSKLFVITAGTYRGVSGRAYRLFPLGGSDRYWRSVPQRDLTVINPENIKIEN